MKSTKTRHGNAHLKGALGIASLAAAGTKNTYYSVRYQRIKTRRGGKRALVAIQRDMLVAIWHMAQTGELYNDPGPDFYTRLYPDRARRRAIAQLETLGYEVTLNRAG